MEIQIRIVFLVLGLLILFGVAVDVFRRRNLTNASKATIKTHRVRNELLDTTQYPEVEADDYVIGPVRSSLSRVTDPMVDDYAYELDAPEQPEIASYLDEESYVDQYEEQPESVSEEYHQVKTEPASIQDVIAIFIMSRSPYGFNGDELYTAISNANLHLGKNNLFYRYAEDNGNGEALFSLVKAVEPGYFNIDILRQEHVPGVTLLMLPSKVSDPLLALDKLIRAAKQISFVLNGELLDHSRQALTLDTIEQYKQQVQTINA